MPIYEGKCPTHGQFEKYEPKYPENDYINCLDCNTPCEIEWSLGVPLPDDMWSGQKTTTRHQIKEDKKTGTLRYTAAEYNSMKHNIDQNKKQLEAKRKKKIRQAIGESVQAIRG